MAYTQNILRLKKSEASQKTLETIPISSDNASINNDNYVSVYNSEPLTESILLKQTEKILICFPKLERQFINLLRERFKANNFSNERMIDSINHVIDNYSGFDKLPTIADFIKFDRKVKIYTHSEVTENNLWGAVETINIGLPQPRWIKTDDFTKYKFKKWIKKESL